MLRVLLKRLKKLKVNRLVNELINKARDSIYISLLVAFVAAGTIVTLIPIHWLSSFIKFGDVNVYRSAFVIMFLLMIVLTRARFENKPIIIKCIVGAVLGYFCSLMAYIVMSFSVHNGLERMQNTLNNSSYFDFTVLMLYVPAVLGGWLFGLLYIIIWHNFYNNK